MARPTFLSTANPPQRGEIWLIRFDPSIGAEIRKIRPAILVNPDAIGRLPLRIVVPVTDGKADDAKLSWFVHLPNTTRNGLAKDSGADAFQAKSLSEARFVHKLGEITEARLNEIASSIARCVGVP